MRPRRVLLDLIAPRPMRAVVQLRFFPVSLQVGMIIVLGLLAAGGLGFGLGMSPEELMTFRKTNLTTLVVWGLWWPGMIAMALAFGRA